MYDVLVRGGQVFDGTGAPPRAGNVGIRDGVVVTLDAPLDAEATEVIDASGALVTPGFIDNHTHYDAEILLAPALRESVRHGVTTICMGSCSLSTIYSDPQDCADLFSRVEAVPEQHVLRALGSKPWSTAAGYRAHIESLPLGPNVMCYAGHSDIRTSVMGLEAATGDREPTEAELLAMEAKVHEALDAGFLGMSAMTNPWDKVGGERARSRPLPSTFARRREMKRLQRILRKRDAISQSAPNITTKVNSLVFLWDSSTFGMRKALKTTLITVADTKSNPMLARVVMGGTKLWKKLFGSDLKWQSIPMPFEVYADGIDLVVFEEFGAGEEALHLKTHVERNQLFADPAYRARFRADYDKRFGPRVWHRDFGDATIVSAPAEGLAGRTFGEVAAERGQHPVDAFLDLASEHGEKLRWKTTIANHRPDVVAQIASHSTVQVGFADSGAHLRNMAFYNFGLHLLRMAKDRSDFMPMEAAVHRLTGEQAAWFGIDAGVLKVGGRADIAVIDPAGLNADLDAYHEAPIEEMGGLERMVRRNNDAVRATIISGRIVFREGEFAEGFGTAFGTGRFLGAGETVPPRAEQALKVAV